MALTVQHPWELYSDRRRYTFLAVLFLISTSNVVDRQIISVLIEPIKSEFGVSDTAMGLLSGIAFAAVYACLGVPIARIADRSDRKKVVTLSLIAWSIMTMICGLVSSFWQLLIARAGVGAGEAGAIPPSQSLIADYFRPEKRSMALAIFFLSAAAGNIIGLIVGGQIAEQYGWRTTLIVFGAAGIPLAILARFVLKEPRLDPRYSEASKSFESLLDTFSELKAKRAFVNGVAGLVFYYMMIYGVQAFAISFVIRTQELDISDATLYIGSVSVVAAIGGTMVGGLLADRLSSLDIAWLAKIPAYGFLVTLPFLLTSYFAVELWLLLSFFGLGLFVIMIAAPPLFSCLHAVCGSKRRATAIAIAYFFANLLGLGLGPVFTGAMSDLFGQMFGPSEGLRYGLVAGTVLFLPASLFLFRAARFIKHDSED